MEGKETVKFLTGSCVSCFFSPLYLIVPSIIVLLSLLVVFCKKNVVFFSKTSLSADVKLKGRERAKSLFDVNNKKNKKEDDS